MSEKFVPTNPVVVPEKITTNFHVIYLAFSWEQAEIIIHLRGEHGEILDFRYGGREVSDTEKQKTLQLIIALNKINLSIKSLQRRIIEKLIADGKLEGTISGTPE